MQALVGERVSKSSSQSVSFSLSHCKRWRIRDDFANGIRIPKDVCVSEGSCIVIILKANLIKSIGCFIRISASVRFDKG